MFDTQTINTAIFIIIFISGLYMWTNILELKENTKQSYPTGGLKEQPKNDFIKSRNDFEKRLINCCYRDRVGEEDGYILKIKDNEGETIWGGNKESMLEILCFNKGEYEEYNMSFDFEIYPMTAKMEGNNGN